MIWDDLLHISESYYSKNHKFILELSVIVLVFHVNGIIMFRYKKYIYNYLPGIQDKIEIFDLDLRQSKMYAMVLDAHNDTFKAMVQIELYLMCLKMTELVTLYHKYLPNELEL